MGSSGCPFSVVSRQSLAVQMRQPSETRECFLFGEIPSFSLLIRCAGWSGGEVMCLSLVVGRSRVGNVRRSQRYEPDYALGYRFDVVLRGRGATPMEE